MITKLPEKRFDIFSGFGRTKNGIVYLICDPSNNMFKIGVTRDFKSNRIKKLQTGNPTELFLHSFYETNHPFKLEKMLHLRFGHERVLNEWFKLKYEDVVNFNKYCEELNETIEYLVANNNFYN